MRPRDYPHPITGDMRRGTSPIRLARLLLTAGLSALLAACASTPDTSVDLSAQKAGLHREELSAGPFILTTYLRAQPGAPLLRVYIEGDGRAWLSRSEVSPDPTPIRAMGLRLAASDDGAAVLYLARPCQFTPMARNPACRPEYWTGLRYAPEVIAAMDEALSRYVQRLRPGRLELVGYSGGGAIAVLLAARRHDVSALRSVAGNLDHVALNGWHQVSQMPGSLNAIDVAQQVARIPQRHFNGADDKVVPLFIARDFAARASPCAVWQVVPGMGHEDDWDVLWPVLLREPLPCR